MDSSPATATGGSVDMIFPIDDAPRLPVELELGIGSSSTQPRALDRHAHTAYLWSVDWSRIISWLSARQEDSIVHKPNRLSVRAGEIIVDTNAQWAEKHVPGLLRLFPALTTLRLLSNWTHLTTVVAVVHAQAQSAAEAKRSRTVTAILKRTLIFLGAGGDTQAVSEPFVTPAPTTLTNFCTVHIDYPTLNAQVLNRISPPRSRARHLVPHAARFRSRRAARLSAAGAGLQSLVLSFHTGLGIGRPAAPQLTNLRSLHLSAPLPPVVLVAIAAHLLDSVLAAPLLEELVIERREDNGMEEDEVQAELDRALLKLPPLKSLRFL
ncbi:hypothetical protein DFH06DRAFT_1328851 [Mycena polygramma]|nr:hypothetical protein DFH06DRAFT_1328851 [Mycena polygramma]